jgi:putative oxidoreductase
MAHTIASHRAASRSAIVTEAATAEDAGKLVLRLTVAILMLMHGVAKITGGVEPIAQMLDGRGLPPDLAYGAYIGEVLAPIMVILGVWTRPAALLMAVNMLFAVALAHMQDLFLLGEQGGWALELQGMYLFGALAIMLLGAGRLSVGGLRGRWN